MRLTGALSESTSVVTLLLFFDSMSLASVSSVATPFFDGGGGGGERTDFVTTGASTGGELNSSSSSFSRVPAIELKDIVVLLENEVKNKGSYIKYNSQGGGGGGAFFLGGGGGGIQKRGLKPRKIENLILNILRHFMIFIKCGFRLIT